MQQKRLSRKEKRQNRENQTETSLNIKLNNISPKTDNQNLAFKNYYRNKTLFLHGLPGTGKTFIAMYLALKSVEEHFQKKIVIVRSAVPTRDIGFMPGSASDKMKHYEAPYQNLCTELFGRGDAYEILKKKGIIEFMPTSFIRGTTLSDSIIIVDEAQNMSEMELHTVISRIGENSRLIICGDIGQDDLTSERYKESTGLLELMKIFKIMKSVFFIEFGIDDILRSDFLKEYIIAKEQIKNGKGLPDFITKKSNLLLEG